MRPNSFWTRRTSRRALLRGSGAGLAGLAGAVLIGCGDDDESGSGSNGTPTATSEPGGGGGQTATTTVAPTGGIKRGGTVRATTGSEPLGSLNPHRGQGGGDHKFFWTMFEGLAQYNRDGVPDPNLSLAEEWEIVDPTTIRFTLREGVKYHDGTELKADDIKYNIELVQSEDYNSAARGQMLPIQEVEIVDDRTPVFHLEKPNSALITLLGDRGGQVVSPTALEKGIEDFDRNPVGGTGPFRFVEWVEDTRVVVEANPEYWRNGEDGSPLPYMERLEFLVVPDANVQLANFEAGDVDIVPPPLSSLDALEAGEQYAIEEFVGSSWSGLYFNTALAPTDDVNLRRAMAYAIDREAENEAINFGRYQIATGIITPATTWAYEPVPNAPYFDLDKAREFLAQSNYPDGAKVTCTISTSQAYATRGALWQDMLKEINVELELIPLQTFTNRMWVVGDVNSLLAGFSLRADPDGTIGEVVHSEGFYNAGHAENPELDTAIENARETYDLEERKMWYQEVEKILADEVYDIYSTYSSQYRAFQPRVQNVSTIFGAEGKDRYVDLWVDEDA
jgi:ABC-type transport system substrate-binding protein